MTGDSQAVQTLHVRNMVSRIHVVVKDWINSPLKALRVGQTEKDASGLRSSA